MIRARLIKTGREKWSVNSATEQVKFADGPPHALWDLEEDKEDNL